MESTVSLINMYEDKEGYCTSDYELIPEYNWFNLYIIVFKDCDGERFNRWVVLMSTASSILV